MTFFFFFFFCFFNMWLTRLNVCSLLLLSLQADTDARRMLGNNSFFSRSHGCGFNAVSCSLRGGTLLADPWLVPLGGLRSWAGLHAGRQSSSKFTRPQAAARTHLTSKRTTNLPAQKNGCCSTSAALMRSRASSCSILFTSSVSLRSSSLSSLSLNIISAPACSMSSKELSAKYLVSSLWCPVSAANSSGDCKDGVLTVSSRMDGPIDTVVEWWYLKSPEFLAVFVEEICAFWPTVKQTICWLALRLNNEFHLEATQTNQPHFEKTLNSLNISLC